MRRYERGDIVETMWNRGLSVEEVFQEGSLTRFGQRLLSYLNYRAELLESQVEPALMNREQARRHFESLRDKLDPQCVLPMNRQTGEKRHHNFLTCIVNMLTEQQLGGVHFDSDPHKLTAITANNKPVRTLSRRMDGAYPGISNPVAVWELKGYYGTTSFGSRIADAVYETELDGLQLAELEEHEGIRVRHYFIADGHRAWWGDGRSYLCRLVDLLHMGLVNEILFGRQALTGWPEIVSTWPSRT